MNKYPADWDQRRRKVYNRDGYECKRCGDSGGSNGDTELYAHHKNPISNGGTHHMSNLVTLCRSCHGDMHPNNPKLATPPTNSTVNQRSGSQGITVSGTTFLKLMLALMLINIFMYYISPLSLIIMVPISLFLFVMIGTMYLVSLFKQG